MLRSTVLFACLVCLPASARADLKPFVDQYCIQCHGELKPKGSLSLHNLSPNPVKRAEIDTWKEVLERVENGDMPPEKSKQPSGEQKQKFITAVRVLLKSAGVAIDDSRWLAPVRGNYLDHDLLFSGKPVDPAMTNPRLWRVSGEAYERFIQQKNRQFGLGLRSYGNDKIRSPWELPFGKEFSDYAVAHRVGDADVEYHLRNVTKVAQAMVKKFAVQKFGGPNAITELSVAIRAGKELTPEQMRAAIVASFEKILNRQLETADIDRYAAFWSKNLQALDAEKACEQYLLAMLMRPDVLYRLEFPTEPGERSILPPIMLARAISFALTDAEPDEPLRADAEAGKLRTREDARRHIERILSDRAIAKPHVLRFFQEYFGYTTAGDIFKDDTTLSEYGLKRQQHATAVYVNDTNRLIEWVLENDKQVLKELLTTPKTFVLSGDGELTKNLKSYAKHLRAGGAPRPPEPGKTVNEDSFGYRGTPVPDAVLAMYEIKLKIKEWDDERPYDMPAEHRMGILTHPSWLISHTTNFDNHAIDRGRWIRERLLGGRVPEIPITVDATLPDEPHVPLRERMRVTRADYCWTCHQYMDPLGLAFEQFDPFGRFRTQELVVDQVKTEERKKKGQVLVRSMKYVTLDNSGEIAKSGDPKLDGPVKGPFELIGKMANSERVEQVFVRHVFRFFLGRNETYADGPVLVAAHRAYRDSHGSMNALLTALMTSDSFLYRGK